MRGIVAAALVLTGLSLACGRIGYEPPAAPVRAAGMTGTAGTAGTGAGGMATEMAVGLSIAQQMLQQQGLGAKAQAAPGAPAASALPELLGPAEVAQTLGVTEQDVITVIESGELTAKKIGASYRIKRSALDEYLAK